MSEYTTIARPYAKAVFAHALSAKKLELWSQLFEGFALICAEKPALSFLDNPASTTQQRASLFDVVFSMLEAKDEKEKAQNFISLLAEKSRLAILPDIGSLYEQLRADYEKTIEVTVRTFKKLSEAHKEKLMHSLEQRLHRKIKINEVLDKNILGGAIIQAGDFVIDGSVKGKLNKLAAGLAA